MNEAASDSATPIPTPRSGEVTVPEVLSHQSVAMGTPATSSVATSICVSCLPSWSLVCVFMADRRLVGLRVPRPSVAGFSLVDVVGRRRPDLESPRHA